MKQGTDGVPASRPPVVAVLGHVDHGKTTLLDKIRSTNLAAGEVGGISQRLTASQITLKGRKITFIDTPGHAAFSAMRKRGSQVADLALLAVSAREGVQPQTREALSLLRESGLPYLVVLTKIDLPEANVPRIKEELLAEGVQLEGAGGKISCLEVSGVTGSGIDQLLEMVCLLSDLLELKLDRQAPFLGTVVEARLDPKKGPVALIIGQQGTLRLGESLKAGIVGGKVRALRGSFGESLREAEPSQPVEVLGFDTVPAVGASVKTAQSAPERKEIFPPQDKPSPSPSSLPPGERLRLIIRADTQGVLEAVEKSLRHLPEAKERLEILFLGTGEITASDILLARSTRASVLAFAARIPPAIRDLARENEVPLSFHNIIYQLTAEVEQWLKEKTEGGEKPRFDRGEIIQIFSLPSGDRVAGVKVTQGRFRLGEVVLLRRGGEEIGRLKIKSLKIGKEKTTQVGSGKECGLIFSQSLPFRTGDVLESLPTPVPAP